MIYELFMLAFCWIIYFIIHSVMATSRVKSWAEKSVSKSTYKLIYNVIALVLLILLIIYQLAVPSPLMFIPNILTYTLGTMISIFGLFIMLVCVFKYFKAMSGLSSSVQSANLEEKGLHQLVRHPLYLGTFIFLAGLCCIFPLYKNAVTTLLIIGYTILAIPWEEKKLLKQYGTGYAAYRLKVPMILPHILKSKKN